MKSKKAKKLTRKQLEDAASELASFAVWALKFMRTNSPGGLVEQGGKLRTWQDWCMDSLDLVGYEIDRKAYYQKKR